MRLVQSSLHDAVAERLREQIFSGQLAAGSFIDETALCATLAISRTPLREALKVLAAEGLVRHEPRRGSFVNQVTERDLDQIFPVLALLEGRSAFEATQQASDAEVLALDGLHGTLQAHAEAGRIPEYYAANVAIHEAIIALADNRWLAMVIGDLRKIAKLARLQQLHVPGRLAQSCGEHMAVFAALQARDAEGADAAMRLHILRQREALREIARAQTNRITA